MVQRGGETGKEGQEDKGEDNVMGTADSGQEHANKTIGNI